MKKAIKALWHGIKTFVTAVVGWAATLIGMNDNSKYSRVLRRIIGTTFAVVVVLWATTSVVEFIEDMDLDECKLFSKDDTTFLSETLSDDLFFFDGYYDYIGYISNAKGKKLIKDVYWVAKPIGVDSLVCYSNGDHRGYFHMRNGKVVVPPVYTHAWVFSEGLAAVEKDGNVTFLDTEGKVAINKRFGYVDDASYVFHKGYCAVHDSTGKHMGLVNHMGEWVIAPQYESINPIDTFWIVSNGNQQAIVSFGLDTVFQMTSASFEILDTAIVATFADHSQSTYTKQGKLMTRSQIRQVDQLFYDTRDVLHQKYSAGEVVEEYYTGDYPETRKDVATCMRYEAESSWYGLMGPDGRLVTPPCYVSIEAIGKDLYLCKQTDDCGVVLDSKGRRVE